MSFLKNWFGPKQPTVPVDLVAQAIKEVGITGLNYRKDRAETNFNAYFDTAIGANARRTMSYEQIKKIAVDWWDKNHNKYSGN